MARRLGWGIAGLLLLMVAAPLAAQQTPEEVVRRFFAAGSGEAGHQPLDDLPGLFVPAGRLVTVRVPDSGPPESVLRSPAEYVESSREWLSENTMYEVPTRFWVEQYGNVGHVFCAFEARRSPDAEPFYRGIASFQLLWDGTRWRIVTAYWQGERPGLPLPARYRP